jgi:hypothetical protein
LPLEINKAVKIESNFAIPFFNKNKLFDSSFINAFVQQLGYSIINDIRVYVKEDEPFLIERSGEIGFDLDVHYSIESFNEGFLSILISRSDYFGGAHPNYYSYTLNFAFNPDRKLSLFDVIDYKGSKNVEEFLKSKIERYSDAECKDILLERTTYEYIYNLDFAFNEKTFSIYYDNLLPHALKACGALEIPTEEIKFKL